MGVPSESLTLINYTLGNSDISGATTSYDPSAGKAVLSNKQSVLVH